MKFKHVLTAALLIILSLTFSFNTRSQILISILLGDKLNTGEIEFGLTGGFNRTNIIGLDEAKGLNNFNLGFYFDFLLKKNWYLYTGVLVKSNMGSSNIPVYSLGDANLDTLMQGGRVDRKINYFNVPLEIKHRFKNRIYVDAGFMFSLRYKATDLFINEIKDKDDLVYKLDIRDQYKRLDAGVIAGLGYKLKKGLGMNIGIRYYYGLVDIIKDGNSKGVNSSLYLYAEIPIGAGKSKKGDNQ